MNGAVVSVDPVVRLTGRGVPGEFSGEQAVVDMEVTRIWAGGGNTAEITVVYPERVDRSSLRELSQSIKNLSDQGGRPRNVRQHPVDVTVDIGMKNLQTGISVDRNSGESRVFTGHVISVVENEDRTVTYYAMDGRYYLNKNMVHLDTGPDGELTTIILDQVLEGGDGEGGTGTQNRLNPSIGYAEGSNRHTSLPNPERIKAEYGIETNISAYEVVRDIVRTEDAYIHIDEFNNLHITRIPGQTTDTARRDIGFTYWAGSALGATAAIPPIIEWESGDEESEEKVLVESSYDEAGIGPYTFAGEETFEEGDIDGVGPKTVDQNVFARSALEKSSDHETLNRELASSSGTARLVGDPRISPYDHMTLDGDVIDDFSPIGSGTFTVTEVRHLVSSSDGFITEVDLGKDIRELYEQFVDQSTNAAETLEGIDREIAEQEGSRRITSPYEIRRDMFYSDVETEDPPEDPEPSRPHDTTSSSDDRPDEPNRPHES